MKLAKQVISLVEADKVKRPLTELKNKFNVFVAGLDDKKHSDLQSFLKRETITDLIDMVKNPKTREDTYRKSIIYLADKKSVLDVLLKKLDKAEKQSYDDLMAEFGKLKGKL